VKKSTNISLTLLAAASFAVCGQSRPDPCAAATFNQQACEAAVQNRGYCWNGRWIKLRYHYPYPYYFDAYQAHLASGGAVIPATVDTCGPRHGLSGAHGVASRAGFGACGAGHSAHG